MISRSPWKKQRRRWFGVALCSIAGAFLVTQSSALPQHGHRKWIPASQILTTKQIVQLEMPSVVTIYIYDADGKPYASGSGFVIAKNLVTTNVHVIRSAGSVTVSFKDKPEIHATGIAAADENRDLAIIQVDTGDAKPLPLGKTEDLTPGDNVVALGAPRGLEATVSTGIVSALRTTDNGLWVQTTAPISHGSSGGPLIDEAGEVIGVNARIREDGENLNFAIAATYLPDLLKSCSAKLLPWSTFVDKPDPSAPAQPDPNAPATPPGDPSPPDDQSPAPSGPPSGGDGTVQVWVNTTSRVYHMPGSRYYGKTRHGKYMTEAEARKRGYRRASAGM